MLGSVLQGNASHDSILSCSFIWRLISFRNLTDILLVTSMVTLTVTFAAFIAINLREVLSSQIDLDYRACVGLTLAVTLVLCSIRQLANLSWIMVLAGLCEFYIIGVIYFFAFDKVVKDPDTATTNIDSYMFGSWAKIPLSFSMCKFYCNTKFWLKNYLVPLIHSMFF